MTDSAITAELSQQDSIRPGWFIIKRKMITIVYSEMRIVIRGLQKRKEPYERLHKMVG